MTAAPGHHVRVYIPTPLRTYTAQSEVVDAQGSTLDELLRQLDESYPGMRFRIIDEQDRIRRHIRIFINETEAEDLARALRPYDRIHILCALSGG